jgi:hypothetical protein
MPSLIIQHFEPLCAYLMPLIAMLSQPQQRHALNVVGALLVCGSKRKCLTTLTAMLRVGHADHYALADFFRASEWCPVEVRRAALVTQMAVVGRVMQAGVEHLPIYLCVDDSLAVKDAGTRALEAVSWHHDHVKQRAQMRVKGTSYSKAARFVTVTGCVHGMSFPLSWRLYLSQKQVKKLNAKRRGGGKLSFTTLIGLVQQMLDETGPHLPKSARVVVLFDSWYASTDLLNDILGRGWQFVCAVKSNRILMDAPSSKSKKSSGSPMSAYWRKLSRQRIKRVTTHSTKGSQTYHTRCTTGWLRGVATPVVAVFSKRHLRKPHVACFIASDKRLRAQGLLRCYAFRWLCETDNFLLKERLGLADFRLHAVEAVQRWFALVFAAYAFVRVRIAQTWLAQPTQPVPSFHDVIAEQQRWHLEHLIVFVASHARNGWSNDQLIAQLLPT